MATLNLKLGDIEREVPIGVSALMVYEQQFGSDMVQDLFGRVSVPAAGEGEAFFVDYRDTNWTALVKAAWACLKAENGNTPMFETWAGELGDVDLTTLAERMIPAAFEAFFRAGDGLSE